MASDDLSSSQSSRKSPLADSLVRNPTALRRLTRRLRNAARLWRLYAVRLQLRLALTEAQRLFALTLLIGVFCGLAAVAFHLAIDFAEHNLLDRALRAQGHQWIVWTLLSPTLGGLLCGLALTFVVPNARGSGIPQVKAVFALRGGRLQLRDAIGKFVLSTLQIGSGASLGREGPTVQICAGIASTLGRVMGVSPRSLRRLLPVGAAAGVAAAFNAPIAAVTFTVEEVVGDLDRSVLSGVIVAAALAAVIERSVLGEHPVFEVPKGYGLHHPSSLLLYAALGVAAGLLAVAFTDGLLGVRAWFRRQQVVPKWMQPAVGGAVTGALAVAAILWIQTTGVAGGGYTTLSAALSGNLSVRVMLVLCAFKAVATVASYSSGGAGGIFAPSLFLGGMLGGAFGALDARLLGPHDDAVGAFALVGMGAAFSGIVRAPLTSILIIMEMTGGYSLIVPLMIANMTSYLIARGVRPEPIYEALLAQDGIHLGDRAVEDALGVITVTEVMKPSASVARFLVGTSGEAMLADARGQEVVAVVDEADAVVGLVSQEELVVLAEEPSLGALVTAADVMRAKVAMKPSDDLHLALGAMLEHHLPRLPVVDEDGRLVGMVDEATIARVYLRGRAE